MTAPVLVRRMHPVAPGCTKLVALHPCTKFGVNRSKGVGARGHKAGKRESSRPPSRGDGVSYPGAKCLDLHAHAEELHVNELPELVKSHMKLFADDAKLYQKIEDHTDSEVLQADIDAL